MIVLREVGKRWRHGENEVTALDDINLTIHRGDFTAVVGPSGSGKSTLLNIIGCLDRPSSGQMIFLGQDTSKLDDVKLSRLRNRSVGFIFQSFNLVPELTVAENVELPLVYARVTRNRRRAVVSALSQVGLGHRMDHPAGLLSGGEQQRAAIARALVNDPDLVLADEPTGSIDAPSAWRIMGLLDRLHQQGRTVVVVTHNLAIATAGRRVVRMAAGSIIQVGIVRDGATQPPGPSAYRGIGEAAG